MQWNLTMQRQLAADWSLRVGYVGSRAIHQPFRTEDADIVLPSKTAAGYLWPQVDAQGNLLSGPNQGSAPSPLNPNTGRMTAGFWDGRSYYDALQVQMKKTIGRAAQLAGSY